MVVCEVGRRPPGTEIYQEEELSLFKVEGSSSLAKRLSIVGSASYRQKLLSRTWTSMSSFSSHKEIMLSLLPPRILVQELALGQGVQPQHHPGLSPVPLT